MAHAVATSVPERTNRIALVAALVFAAVASALVFVAVQDRSGGGSVSPLAGTEVVVAARDVPANTVLTVDMLELVSLPDDAIVEGAYGVVAPLIGTAVRFPIARGEQLTPLKVGAFGVEDERDLALVLAAGRRAFSVEVSEVTGVGGLLLPGNAVDVIAVFDETTAGSNKAVTLLQNVVVLAVAQEAQEPVPAAGTTIEGEERAGTGVNGQRPEDVERQPDARTVTVAVTPEDAQLLALLQAQGDGDRGVEIMLSLRPAGETDILGVPELFPPIQLILPPPPAE